MTGHEHREVDLDLLADYLGGALDGTPDEPVVARLVADDAAWRAARDSLAAGMASVGEQLRALSEIPEPMPDDVAARIDAAFAPTARAVAEDPAPRPVPTATSTAPAQRHLSAVPGSGAGNDVTAARRRRLRWAAPAAVAAGVIAVAGFAVGQLVRSSGTASSTAASDHAEPMFAPAESAEAAGGAAAVPAPDLVTTSGTDYDETTLATGVVQPFTAPADPGIQGAPGLDRSSPGATSAALDPLRPRAALLACLDAVARDNAAGPITVRTVDYARYRGAPAVIVRFVAANGTWAQASSPTCGAPGAGSAELAKVPVR
ncbi:hypothetical protein [Mangrovihabitans endophyticus]|uniref:Uncharacterized protein n=1 Tax=Mangrovihabitans endophyticus TaxID=1751298 RepID=A0A8J3FP80_9ACTN|nr:hypothetical protein [Mangrovihabitans endophyticus]GGK93372.1 hypothetical protein GCM10012284_29150 [Mangrovihabitans endophyticus]